MHIKCPKINKICPFCAESRYNPLTGGYDELKLFCGLAPPSWDTRVGSLPECPKVMTKSALRKWQKEINGNVRVRRL